MTIRRGIWDTVSVLIIFILLGLLNFNTLSAANRSETEARRVRVELERINVPAQNRCIVKVVLSFPPPIQEEEFDTVLAEYDNCIDEESGEFEDKEEVIPE